MPNRSKERRRPLAGLARCGRRGGWTVASAPPRRLNMSGGWTWASAAGEGEEGGVVVVVAAVVVVVVVVVEEVAAEGGLADRGATAGDGSAGSM